MCPEFQKLEKYILTNRSNSISCNNFEKFKLAYNLLKKNINPKQIKNAVDTANIAALEIGLGTTSIISSLLNYLPDNVRENSIKQNFNQKVYQITSSINKLSKDSELLTLRKLITEIAKDIRIVLIIISKELHSLRKKNFLVKNKFKELTEIKTVYLPLSRRLGLVKLSSELEDFYLKFLYPNIYYKIVRKLKLKKSEREVLLERFIEPLKKKLISENLKFQIFRRTKSISSIWDKIKRRKVPFEEVYDLSGLRIVLDIEGNIEKEQATCWKIFNIIKSLYEIKKDRIRDWISIPKSNGYEALHLTVLDKENYWAEIQIKTRRMHHIAERGSAAHWRYKGVNFDFLLGLNEWLDQIKTFLDDKVMNLLEDNNEQILSLLEKNNNLIIHKNNKIYKLQKNSTLVDFIFLVNKKNAIHCKRGEVNGLEKNMNYALKNGDNVKLYFNEEYKFDKNWLNFAKTKYAQKEINNLLGN